MELVVAPRQQVREHLRRPDPHRHARPLAPRGVELEQQRAVLGLEGEVLTVEPHQLGRRARARQPAHAVHDHDEQVEDEELEGAEGERDHRRRPASACSGSATTIRTPSPTAAPGRPRGRESGTTAVAGLGLGRGRHTPWAACPAPVGNRGAADYAARRPGSSPPSVLSIQWAKLRRTRRPRRTASRSITSASLALAERAGATLGRLSDGEPCVPSELPAAPSVQRRQSRGHQPGCSTGSR